MKYLMLVCVDGPIEAEPGGLDPEAWVKEMDGRGVRLMGSVVRPAEEATTVRVRNGEVLVTDGPYAETKEQMAGFDLIECENLDEAIAVAAKHPMARYGMIDLRACYDL